MLRWVVFALSLGGCFAPTYPEGLACGEGQPACPPGQTCGLDGTCRAMPVREDAGTTTDGPLGVFTALRPLDELNGSSTDQDPALTPNLLVIYFSSDRPGGLGGTDLYRASRPHADALFDTPQRVIELNSSGNENHPWISPDGRTIYFDSDRGGSFDIWRATWNVDTVSWNAPETVAVSLASSLDNAPDVHENELVFGSDRKGAERDLYRSLRATAEGPWEDAEHLSELSSADIESGPTQWAEEIYFMRQRVAAQPRIMRAPRMGASFGTPSEVTEVGDASDPWISPDGRTLFLTVIPNGNPDLFVTQR